MKIDCSIRIDLLVSMCFDSLIDGHLIIKLHLTLNESPHTQSPAIETLVGASNSVNGHLSSEEMHFVLQVQPNVGSQVETEQAVSANILHQLYVVIRKVRVT